MLGAGNLNRRITIQTASSAATARSASGTVTWSDTYTVWAAIWPVSARKILQGQQMVQEVTHRIRIRFRTDITSRQRVKYEDKRQDTTRYFKIRSVLNWEERNRWLDLMCEELLDE